MIHLSFWLYWRYLDAISPKISIEKMESMKMGLYQQRQKVFSKKIQ